MTTNLAVSTGPYAFQTLVTIRLSHRVVTVESDAQHWVQYRSLIEFLRGMRKDGWKIEGVERIDHDLDEADLQKPTT